MPEKTKEIAVDSVVYEGATGTIFELIAIEGTVWMTMQQMAVVFGVDRSVVGKHVRNIYATEELERARTWAKFAQVRDEGGRRVTRNTDYYSLDVIIAVGYRVNSKKATKFRIWATQVLKDYLVHGSATNARFAQLEGRLDSVECSINSIIDTLMPTLTETRESIGFKPS